MAAEKGQGKKKAKPKASAKPATKTTTKKAATTKTTKKAATKKTTSKIVEKKTAPKKTESKKQPAKKTQAAISVEPDLKEIIKQLDKIERSLNKVGSKLDELKGTNKDNVKRLNSLENKLETRIKREEMMMTTLGYHSRSKKGDKSMLDELGRAVLKSEEYLLHTGKRIDNILSAVKNHREYLVKLNKRVYKADAREKIQLELDIMSNTLSIMIIKGFDFDKSLLKDIERVKDMMDKKDSEVTKIKKRMDRLDKKFEEELERFDFKSIYEKKKDIPGYG